MIPVSRAANLAIRGVVVALAVVLCGTLLQPGNDRGVVTAAKLAMSYADGEWRDDPLVTDLHRTFAAEVPVGAKVFLPEGMDFSIRCHLAEVSVMAGTYLVADRNVADYEVSFPGAVGEPVARRLQVRRLK